VDSASVVGRAVSGWGHGGDEHRLTLRFDMADGVRIEVETTANPSLAGDPWWRFSHQALIRWGMARRLGLPERIQLETGVVLIPVDDREHEMFFLGDASHWVVGGRVGDRAASVLASSFAVDALRLTAIDDLAGYTFLDEGRTAPPDA
jgi:hypothetical protein